MEVFVARQPIFDRAREVYGYELLFRPDDSTNACDGPQSSELTTQVIANALLSIGLDNIVCGKKAFLNFNNELLAGGAYSMLPKESTVLEILETVEPTEQLFNLCRGLKQQGYTFALDDYVGDSRMEPLTEIAQLIKIDIQITSREAQEKMLRTYRPRGIAVLAEKVETPEEYEWAKRAGYDYFQGYFFARPAVMRGSQIPAGKVNCLRLLREMQYPDLNFAEITKIVSEDVALSYKLLRYANSALFAGCGEMRSIPQALARLGEDVLRHWAALAALPLMAKDKPGELVTHSLVRARFCERLMQLASAQSHGLGFLMGLFSLLDALIDVPLEEALQKAGITGPIRDVLVGTAEADEPLHHIYALVRQYEATDWKGVSEAAAKLGIKTAAISEAYAESTLWAQQALHATVRKGNSRKRTRYPAEGSLQILLEDAMGREKVLRGRLLNVSVNGLQIELEDRIPLHAAVACNSPKHGISGRGSVRYCNPRKGKFLVGLEFGNGTGWREPA